MPGKNRKELNKWIINNGCAEFDLVKKDIILYDGGLFSISKKKLMLSKVIGTKLLKNGGMQILYSKKKYPHEEFQAIFWFEELDDVLNYFRRMKRKLNKLGYKTSYVKK